MTQQQMMERVKQHHPSITEAQIRIWLNQALDSFCRQTKILKSAFTFDTVVNQRWYALDDSIVEVKSIDYNGYIIPRLQHPPEKRDLV